MSDQEDVFQWRGDSGDDYLETWEFPCSTTPTQKVEGSIMASKLAIGDLEDVYDDNEDDEGFCHRCPSPSSLTIIHPLCNSFVQEKHLIDRKDIVPCDKVASLSYSPDCNLTWDNVKVPIPYRFQPEHIRIATAGRQSISVETPNFLLDSKTASEQYVDTVWRDISPSSQPAVILLRECLQKPVYITAKEFILNTFHLLCGRTSQVFILDAKSGEFVKNPAVLVHGVSPSAIWNFSLSFCQCGSIVERFSRYAAFDSSCFKKEGFTSNAVALAFIKFVINYLKIYQTLLMLNSPCISTFSQLLRFIKPFQTQLVLLDQIWWKSCPSHNAVDLLSHLNWLVIAECGPYTSDIIRNLFITCASAYLKYVSDWIFQGKLAKQSEFHVVRLRERSYRDRRYWTKQFQHATNVPAFLSESSTLVFETGKAISLLTEIQNERVLRPIPLLLCELDVVLSPVFTFEDAERLSLEWSSKLKSFREAESHVIDDIDQTINKITAKYTLVNSDETEKLTTAEVSRRHFAALVDIKERKKLKQLQHLADLNQQVSENKARHLKELEDEKEAERKNQDYILMRDKRDQLEQKRMDMKHFGEGYERRPTDKKGFFHRLHGGVDSVDADSKDFSLNTHNVDEEGDKIELLSINGSTVENSEFEPLSAFDHKHGLLLDGTAGIESRMETPAVDNITLKYSELETDEKFDPNKVLSPSPPPYPTDHINLTADNSFLSSLLSSTSLQIKNPTNQLGNVSKLDEHCINMLLSQSVTIPLTVHNEITNLAVLQYFVCEKKLFHHVEALNGFLCLQYGLFGYTLNELLIQEVDRSHMKTQEDIAAKIGRLNIILAEAIALENEEDECATNLAFALNVKSQSEKESGNKRLTSAYDILDSIKLCYKVQWPLNIIFTEELLHQYERLFNFLMKLLRVEFLLKRSFLSLKFKNYKGSQLFILHNYRSRLLHFVRTIRNYVYVTVIQCGWEAMCSSFKTMDSMDKIYDGLVRHIKTINTNCLLGTKAEGLMKLLTDQLVVIEAFCSQVESVILNVKTSATLEISDHDFKRLTQKFKAIEEIGKVFLEVAYKLVNKGYYPKVSYFLELYNFNGFFQIRSSKEGRKHNITVTSNC